MNTKPHAHYFVDDRAIHINDWKRIQPITTGIIAGAFDLIHPGYCRMFRECKQYCSYLTVALHSDPSIERNKLAPIHSIQERIEILESIKYIDEIIVYDTECDLLAILKNNTFDIRFLGNDYYDKSYTGKELNIKTIFINRNHQYSTTKLKQKITKSYLEGVL